MAERDGARSERARAAFDAVKHLKGRPSPEIREALQSELDARGVADVRDGELDFLGDAVQRSPIRKLLKDSAELKWVDAPDGIADLQTFRDDQRGGTAILDADTLHPFATSSLGC